MAQYEVVILEGGEQGEPVDRLYEASSPQEAYDLAAADGFVMEVADPEEGSVVDEINMWQ